MKYGSERALKHMIRPPWCISRTYAEIFLDAVSFYTGGSYQPYPSEGWMDHYASLFYNFLFNQENPIQFLYWMIFKSSYGRASITKHYIITSDKVFDQYLSWRKKGVKTEIQVVKDEVEHHITSNSALPITRCELKLSNGEPISDSEFGDAANKLMAIPELRDICINSKSKVEKEGIVWIN